MTSFDEMDKAAEIAAEELCKFDRSNFYAVAAWWKRNYMAAGHKRLAHVLLKAAGLE